MNSIFTLKTALLTALAILSGAAIALAQNCTANAVVCGSTTTLTGGVPGTVSTGSPSWTFVSAPVTPVVASPGFLTTKIPAPPSPAILPAQQALLPMARRSF